MIIKNMKVTLLSAVVVLFAPLAKAELIIYSENKQYNILTEVETRQIPTEESLKQLMDLYNLDESIDQIIGKSADKKQTLINAVYSSIGFDVDSLDTLTDEQKIKIANFNDVLGKYADYIFENNKDEMLKIYKQAFYRALQSTYSQKEIDAQIEFYSTPIGAEIIKKQSVFTNMYYESAYPQIMEIQNKNMQEATIKLAEDIKLLKNKNNQ